MVPQLHPLFSLDNEVLPDQCPCSRRDIFRRMLQEDDEPPIWQTIVVGVTLFLMFVVMMMDWIGPDWVMVSGLIVFMVTEIVTIPEGLQGFSNEGILTVMSLFVVAEGLRRTGMLDHYMQLLWGHPKTIAGAQVRLMIPIAILSAFLNNTPIVAVMIPLTLRWSKIIGVHVSQLLIPLSYATILGGTCTLVGTSTNLVVTGLLEDDYPNDPASEIGLFDIAIYGVPNAMIGIAYMLAFAPFLLPKGGTQTSTEVDSILLGARVTAWSPAAGQTVKRSGLADAGGIYLVSIRREANGSALSVINDDLVISVNDELYFTGIVEEFSSFCDNNGLEVITTSNHASEFFETASKDQIGTTKETTFAADEMERLQIINRMVEQIHGKAPYELRASTSRVIITTEAFSNEPLLLVAVDTPARPGLHTDISTIFLQQGLEIRHSEATVIGQQSLSVWCCQSLKTILPDLGDLWSTLSSLLQTQTGVRKQIVRAVVTNSSKLIGHKACDFNFGDHFLAALVAYQKKGKNVKLDVEMGAGDLLALELTEGSPLYGMATIVSKDTNVETELVDIESADAMNHDARNDLDVLYEEDYGFQDKHFTEGEFSTAFILPPQSFLSGKSMAQSGYAKLEGVVLLKIERLSNHGKKTSPLNESSNTRPDTVTSLSNDDLLRAGDILWFSGSAEAISDLTKIQGLVLFEDEQCKKAAPSLQDRRLIQAVVARNSPLLGHTLRESRFRSKYGGAVIAIQRGSDRIRDHPADVRLQTGDVLLIQAGPLFADRHVSNYKTFALISEVHDSAPPRPRLFLLCIALIVASLAIAALEIRSLLITSAIVGIVMVGTGVVGQQEARDSIRWDLFVVVASAFGVGNAMRNSGVAEGLARFLVRIGRSLGIGGKDKVNRLFRSLQLFLPS
jgi:di/tricarboxylate transporter